MRVLAWIATILATFVILLPVLVILAELIRQFFSSGS